MKWMILYITDRERLRNVLLINSVSPNEDIPGPSTSQMSNEDNEDVFKHECADHSYDGGTLKFLEDLMIKSNES